MYNIDEIKKISIMNFVSGKKRKVSKGYLFEECPFCSHKWHFAIDIQKNLFHSYNSCIQGGDVISFIQKKDNISFKETIEKLGDSYNIRKSDFKPLPNTELNLIKEHQRQESRRIQKIFNDFFRFLKRMKFNKSFEKCLKMDNDRLLHYIYNLEGMGCYKI